MKKTLLILCILSCIAADYNTKNQSNIPKNRTGIKRHTYSAGKTRKRRQTGGKWSQKYKKSINCRRPKGFSQRQHCKYGRK